MKDLKSQGEKCRMNLAGQGEPWQFWVTFEKPKSSQSRNSGTSGLSSMQMSTPGVNLW